MNPMCHSPEKLFKSGQSVALVYCRLKEFAKLVGLHKSVSVLGLRYQCKKELSAALEHKARTSQEKEERL